MDTSETYILMCEKAEEVQRSRPPIIPTTLYRFEDGKEVDCRGDYIASVRSDDCVLLYKYIWLPRQDQLQEMISSSPGVLIDKFDSWFQELSVDMPTKSWDDIYFKSSMEQLWLAFVMHEKYGKVWNGSDWVLDKQADA